MTESTNSQPLTLGLNCSVEPYSLATKIGGRVFPFFRGEKESLEEFLPRGMDALLEVVHGNLAAFSNIILLDGPGSFTGLRGQCAFLKGFYFGMEDLPVTAVNGFAFLALVGSQRGLTGEAWLIPHFDRLGFYGVRHRFGEPMENLREHIEIAYHHRELAPFLSGFSLWGQRPPEPFQPLHQVIPLTWDTLFSLDLSAIEPRPLSAITPTYFKRPYA